MPGVILWDSLVEGCNYFASCGHPLTSRTPVVIAKTFGNARFDFGVGYSANLGATETSAFENRDTANPTTVSDPENTTTETPRSTVVI